MSDLHPLLSLYIDGSSLSSLASLGPDLSQKIPSSLHNNKYVNSNGVNSTNKSRNNGDDAEQSSLISCGSGEEPHRACDVSHSASTSINLPTTSLDNTRHLVDEHNEHSTFPEDAFVAIVSVCLFFGSCCAVSDL